jgi:acyl-coenzyme A thioesterase PaaI-like protein
MSSSYIRKAVEFIKVVNQLEKHPGFGLALGFSSLHVRAEQFQFEDKTLKIKFPLTCSLLWSDSKTSNVGLLSTFAALIDETTSLALVVADPSRGRPGVSVVLSVEAGPGLTALTVGDEIEIISHVQRTGRNLGFTKAEIRSVPTGQLICTGSHIKFLNNYGRLGNFFLSSYGWPFFKGYCDIVLKDPAEELSTSQSLPELFASLENSDGSSFSFRGSPALSSLGAPLHGGAQAVLMERAAEASLPADESLVMDSMEVEYLSSPDLQPVLKSTQLPVTDGDKVVVRVELSSKGKLRSAGLFRYSRRVLPSSRL